MRHVATVLLLTLLTTATAAACFGPKLYLGIPGGAKSEALAALVTLYVKEKTGTEIVAVPLEGRDPRVEIASERLDMALASGGGEAEVLLEAEDRLRLISGERPLNDLQFTTVGPALRKLDGLLEPSHLRELTRRVAAGDSATAAAREFLMERGWI